MIETQRTDPPVAEMVYKVTSVVTSHSFTPGEKVVWINGDKRYANEQFLYWDDDTRVQAFEFQSLDRPDKTWYITMRELTPDLPPLNNINDIEAFLEA